MKSVRDEKFIPSVVEGSPSIGSKKKKIYIFLGSLKYGLGRYSSGQRGQTVNLLTTSSQVRILLSPQKVYKGLCMKIQKVFFEMMKLIFRFA